MNTSQCTIAYQSRSGTNTLENTYIAYEDGSYKYYNIDGTAYYHDGYSKCNFFMAESGMFFFFRDVDGWRSYCWDPEEFHNLLNGKENGKKLGIIFQEMLRIQAEKKKQRINELYSVMASTQIQLAMCH